MVDKSYCMSSFLSLRYVEDDEKQFFEGLHHQVYKQQPLERKVFVSDAHDIDIAIRNVFRRISHEKLGMLLSGGMDGLLSKNWSYDEYIKRSIYIDPVEVLKEPYDMNYLFERYRLGRSSIDYLRFYDEIVTDESYASYENAFETAEMDFIDPYELLKISHPLDLGRIRNGDAKYLIRDLFRMKYPETTVPLKQPMPRPVDEYFKDWEGPKRDEFRKDINIKKYSGNQKWLLYCLERFLNLNDNKEL